MTQKLMITQSKRFRIGRTYYSQYTNRRTGENVRLPWSSFQPKQEGQKSLAREILKTVREKPPLDVFTQGKVFVRKPGNQGTYEYISDYYVWQKYYPYKLYQKWNSVQEAVSMIMSGGAWIGGYTWKVIDRKTMLVVDKWELILVPGKKSTRLEFLHKGRLVQSMRN